MYTNPATRSSVPAAVTTLPPYEWPTRIAGLLTRPRVRISAATSLSRLSRPYCAAITSYPSAWSGRITLLKHEPSAQMPWANTMLGLVWMDMGRSPLRVGAPVLRSRREQRRECLPRPDVGHHTLERFCRCRRHG